MASLHHLASVSNVSSWWAPLQSLPSRRRGGGCLCVQPLRIEAGAGKKRVPRTESHKVRNLRARRLLTGTSQRPRLLVFCSDKHLYAQVIDDTISSTLVSACTAQQNISAMEKGSSCPILDAAKKLGEEVAMECLRQGITRVIYYRRGTLHWKRVKTFRLAAQDYGLEFEYPDEAPKNRVFCSTGPLLKGYP